MPASLLAPFRLRDVEFRNRLGLPPMSQYSAVPGEHAATSWHLHHYATRALGVGTVIVEATAISREALVTPHDLGIWTDDQQDSLAAVAEVISDGGAVPALQLSHGGRKGSRTRPWDGDRWLRPDEGGWEVIGPSPIPFASGYPVPRPAGRRDIDRVLYDFQRAARRAAAAGFRMLELHAGHGRLLHSFLSPVANQRSDHYGASFDNRARLLLETVSAVRGAWPHRFPLAVRLSCDDYEPGGWTLPDTLRLAPLLARAGVDLIDCTSGGIRRPQTRRPAPGYQVQYAAAVRKTGVATAAVGLINDMRHAGTVIDAGHADLVLMGRRLLVDPALPLRAVGAEDAGLVPRQYQRALQTVPASDFLPEL
ncbi:oxidoreductase [Marinitenerispora sediminis]|uniref:Oxidoreductase n=1 Tax=Marinitenerispora sediminis TaxID=1931232 RepID=A0A368T8X4_9ACTN|nr:oxidoreductase [Marinitenerispora sediminis]RCV51854.1 oxidoreductase [Marinitenerispora sediminis]RCV54823.1 oxidoreductase [Marinitenerispora sediminis]RCV58969.1 oxidoreductase [Marinitenerispora sediminis]